MGCKEGFYNYNSITPLNNAKKNEFRKFYKSKSSQSWNCNNLWLRCLLSHEHKQGFFWAKFYGVRGYLKQGWSTQLGFSKNPTHPGFWVFPLGFWAYKTQKPRWKTHGSKTLKNCSSNIFNIFNTIEGQIWRSDFIDYLTYKKLNF